MKIVLPKTDISPAIDIEKALNKNMMVVSVFKGRATLLFNCGWPYKFGEDISHGFTRFNYQAYALSGMSNSKKHLIERIDSGEFTDDGQAGLYAFSSLKEFCEKALKEGWIM